MTSFMEEIVNNKEVEGTKRDKSNEINFKFVFL